MDGEHKAWIILFFKSGRAIWIVFLSIVLILTVFYGVVLNTFESPVLAIVISALVLGILIFLAIFDIKEARDRIEDYRKDRVSVRRVKRTSEKD